MNNVQAGAKAGIEWRPCPGAPSFEISENGAIRRVKYGKQRSELMKPLAPYLARDGYLYAVLREDGAKIKAAVHRLVCEAFHGPPPTKKHHAAHADDQKLHNHKGNLRWATPTENAADKVKNGRQTYGGDSHSARLNPKDVAAIRQTDRPHRALAREYGVSDSTIRRIRSRQTWAAS